MRIICTRKRVIVLCNCSLTSEPRILTRADVRSAFCDKLTVIGHYRSGLQQAAALEGAAKDVHEHLECTGGH